MGNREYLPEWLRKKYEEGEKHPEIREKFEEITDFPWLIECVWRISNRDYQDQIWVNHENLNIVDTYMDTTMYFIEDTDTVFKAKEAGRIRMSAKQYEMLNKLYHIVDEYDRNPDNPFSDYGINDKAIVNDPKWDKIRNYAKEVYEELIKKE